MKPDEAAGQAPSDADAATPSDRDEKARAPADNAQLQNNRDSMRQARADVEGGMSDTERYGTPSDVPSAADNADDHR